MTSFTRKTNSFRVEVFSMSLQENQPRGKQLYLYFIHIFICISVICASVFLSYIFRSVFVIHIVRWAGVAAPKSWSQPVGGQPPSRQHRVNRRRRVEPSCYKIWDSLGICLLQDWEEDKFAATWQIYVRLVGAGSISSHRSIFVLAYLVNCRTFGSGQCVSNLSPFIED